MFSALSAFKNTRRNNWKQKYILIKNFEKKE